MGKAKRKLNAARKEIFREMRVKMEDPTGPIGKYYTDENTTMDENARLFNLASEIRNALFCFVDETGHPLCEHLDIDNVVNYLRWVLL